MPEYTEDLNAPNIGYGTLHWHKHHIASADIGNSDPDRSGSTPFVAPSGYRILSNQVHRSGHHSGVSTGGMTQPGLLSYENAAYAQLMQTIREGVLSGMLTDGQETAEGELGGRYDQFLRKFSARYSFVASTHAQIDFRWYVDSETTKHGGRIEAYADIQLEKVATENDANRAYEAIMVAIESEIQKNIFELLDTVLKVPEPESDSEEEPETPPEEEENSESEDEEES